MVSPVLVRRLLYVCLAVLLAIVVYGSVYVSHLALLLLLPPSLTYYMLDAVKVARHQKKLLAELGEKVAARRARDEAAAAAPASSSRQEKRREARKAA